VPKQTRKARTAVSRRPARKVARKAVSAAGRPSTAIVVRAPGPKPWLIQPEELTILKNALCKGATDTELQFCLTVARRRGLDPFKGQIWFVPRRDRGADDGEGGTGAKVWIPVTSIGGLCHVGARDHKDYGSFSEPTFGPDIEVEWRWKGQGKTNKLKVPEWARVEAHKKFNGTFLPPTVGKVWWTEIYPNIDYAPMVRQMPKRMLSKCAQAQAIRLAYPETGGLYIAEEMQETGAPQFTPEGRTIIEKTPQEQAYDQREQENLKNMTPAQREVVERKMREAEARKAAPPIDIPAKQEAPAQTLCYRFYPESETYKIGGPAEIVKAQMQILRPLWSDVAKAFVATPAQLGKLISQFERIKLPFHEYREPGES
jgi:RecT family protein